MVLEAGVVGDPMPDYMENLLAAFLQEVFRGGLEWEQEDLLELVEPSVQGEKALGAVPEVPLQV